MKNNVRRLINELADEVRVAYDIPIPIIDLREVVHMMNGAIEYSIQLQFDGRIKKSSDGTHSFVISLPVTNSDLRDRFTIAHELGHLFLHMGYMSDDGKWENINPSEIYNRDNEASEREYQANEFAAALLMPQEEFKKKIDEFELNGRVAMTKVADYFGVSLEAAINRGRWLGYLEW